jgi:hypothetical protein
LSRVFGDIPAKEAIRENWKQYQPFLRMAHHARTTAWGLQDDSRRVLGVLVMLEEHEALVAHQAERIEALEAVNTAQAERIRGLEMTIGRMKKRKESSEE